MSELRAAAQAAFGELSEIIAQFVSQHPAGVRNDEVAKDLGLETSYNGGQRNYLTFTLLSALVQSQRIRREKVASRVVYISMQ